MSGDCNTCKISTVSKFCWYLVIASSNFATVTFFAVFKMCRHRVNAACCLIILLKCEES